MKAVGYLRLSRHDPDKDRPLEERFALRARHCEELARRHGLELGEVLRDQASGERLHTRPDLVRLLEMAERREITHIVTPAQDRLLRGDKRDEATIEDALCDAGITLVTGEGLIDFGAEDYDPLGFEIRALMGRHELRKYARRRQDTNRQKARAGDRYCGYAPYGYRWLQAERRYETVEAEYTILCEVFRRLLAGESLYRLVRELTARGVAAPGDGRRRDASDHWQPTSLHRILHNPFYAGYPTQRSRVLRGRRRLLDRDSWIPSEEEGSYPHPITLADYERLLELLASRTRPGAARSRSSWLLTGLLYCGHGGPMRAGGSSNYHCTCAPHAGAYLARETAEAAALWALGSILESLPLSASPDLARVERAGLARELQAAERTAREKRQAAAEMMQRVALLVRSWGEEAYEAAARQARAEVEEAEGRVERLRLELASTPGPMVAPTISAVRAAGLPAVWERLDSDGRRAVLGAFLSRVSIVQPAAARRHVRRLVVTPAAFASWWPAREVDVRMLRPHHLTAKKQTP